MINLSFNQIPNRKPEFANKTRSENQNSTQTQPDHNEITYQKPGTHL